MTTKRKSWLSAPFKRQRGAPARSPAKKTARKVARAESSRQTDQAEIAIPAPIASYVFINRDNEEILVAREQAQHPAMRSFIAEVKKNRNLMHYQIVMKSIAEVAASGKRFGAGNGLRRDRSSVMEEARKIFVKAAEKRASDIYIIVEGGICNVKLRVDGAVGDSGMAYEAQTAMAIIRCIYEVISDGADTTYQPQKAQNAQISDPAFLPKGVNSMRVETGPNARGHDMCLRLLDESAGIPETAESTEDMMSLLGYTAEQNEHITYYLRQPSGIIVIAGPTGSGKSTTLKYALQGLARARPDLMVRTVEDPVEYPMSGIIQTSVTNIKSASERSKAFSDFLASTLRKAPDVIMIGEIRDGSTARTAIEAAMTGHLVFSTLHTSSAWQIMSRLADKLLEGKMENIYSFIGDPQIMIGMIYQRLVRRLCPHCALPVEDARDFATLDKFVQKAIIQTGLETKDIGAHAMKKANRGGKCDHCGGRGTRGRMVIAEVVSPTESELNFVRRGEVEEARLLWERERPNDGVPVTAMCRVLEGLIDPRDALHHARSFRLPQDFQHKQFRAPTGRERSLGAVQ